MDIPTFYRKVTHLAAAGAVAGYTFLQTPAGQALIKQYPHLATLFAMIGTLFALYHIPVPSQSNQ